MLESADIVIYPLLTLAGLVYCLYRLPLLLPSNRHAHLLTSPEAAPGWTLDRSRKMVSLWSTSYNAIPALIAGRFPLPLRKLYDLGVPLSVLGGLVAIAGSLWAFIEVWTAVWLEAKLHAAQAGDAGIGTSVKLAKRAVDLLTSSEVEIPASSSGGIKPLIPGVTVPWAHMPTLVLALFANQLFHEFGHALAGALDGISPSRISLNLHVVIPSMTLSFPNTVHSLPTMTRLRIATSGPWHNLLTYLLIGSMALSGVGNVFWSDISSRGRAVDAVEPLSPLFTHLRAGHVITHLDDIFLGGNEDTWTSYLQSDEIGDAGRGWCMDATLYEALPEAPCTKASEITFERTITASTQSGAPRCLAPHPVLDVPSGPCPCPNARWACIRPAAEEQIVRIQLGSRSRKSEQVVLWSGDRKGILEGVQVGTMAPRWPASLVRWVTLYLQYASTIALSLFLFNLLPLPSTDGSRILRDCLHLMQKRSGISTTPKPRQKPFQATLTSSSQAENGRLGAYKEFELEDDDDIEREGPSHRATGESGWQRKARRGIEVILVGVILGWAAGWAMLALLRSS